MFCQINQNRLSADYLIQMKKKKRTSLGCLFWIALILLVVVIFLFNRENIKNVINKTNLKSLITSEKKKENKAEKPEVKITTVKPKKVEKAKSTKSNEITIKIEEQQPSAKNKRAQEREKPKIHIRKARIFFAHVDKSGKIHLKGVIKEVKFIDSPLRETLLTLLKGPNTVEMNRGLLTLIPRETKIKNIYIKHDVAYIDFSENFRFNPLGVEGLRNQLKQIVYTATEFNNIKRVQILINGRIEKYLGPEGIYIGKPLSRSDFEEN